MVGITTVFGCLLPENQQRELFQYRYKVFIEQLGWELKTEGNIETDQFDNKHTCHVIAKTSDGDIIGCSRLLPTTQPYLLECIFPSLLNGLPPPKEKDIWELSRFTSMNVDSLKGGSKGQMTGELTQSLLWESFDIAKQNGAKGIVAVSPLGVERLLKSMGIKGQRLGNPKEINGHMLFACYVDFRHLENTRKQRIKRSLSM
ncbi:MAG: N-acyl-L-homoserine lactone synthetase [Arenicella sp.]|jgi:N-acyl-L-homoserine lactone synthetase